MNTVHKKLCQLITMSVTSLCRKVFPLNKNGWRCVSTVTGLPFKIKKNQVSKIILESKGMFEKDSVDDTFTKTEGIIKYKGDPIEKKYLPFHSADIKRLSSSFTGRYGHNETEYYWTTQKVGDHWVPVMRSRTVICWTNCSGTVGNTDYPLGTISTQVYAGFEYPREHIENSLRHVDVAMISNQNPDSLTKKSPHDMNMSFAIEKIVASLHKMEEKRIEHFIKRYWNADHAEVTTTDMNLHEAQVDLLSFHMPAYVYTFDAETHKSLHKIISGYTGQLEGEKVYSSVKVGSALGVAGFVLGGLTLLSRSNPYITAGAMALRFLGPAAAMGSASALWAHLYSGHKYKMNRDAIKEESEYNSKTEETEEDIQRKTGFDKTTRSTSGHINLPETECRLLGINHVNELSLKILKSQYHKAIKKWHPDTYNGDKNLANDMTARINDAYHKLEKLIK